MQPSVSRILTRRGQGVSLPPEPAPLSTSLRAISLLVLAVVAWVHPALACPEGPRRGDSRSVHAQLGSGPTDSSAPVRLDGNPSCVALAEESIEFGAGGPVGFAEQITLELNGQPQVMLHRGASTAPNGWRPSAPFGRAPPA